MSIGTIVSLATAALLLSASALAQADATFVCDGGAAGHTYTASSGSSLTIQATNGDGDCSMTGSIPASAQVTLASVGVTAASGTANAGTLTFTGLNDGLATPDGGTFTNSGTILDVATGYRQSLYAGAFINTGTIHSAGSGDTLVFDNAQPAGLLDNAGRLQVDVGADLEVDGPGTLRLEPGSTTAVDPAGRLQVRGTTLDVAGGTGTGAISFFGSGVSFESSASSSSGTIDGQSNNSLTGTVPARWTITETGGSLAAAAAAANAGTIVLVGGNPALSATGAFANTGTIFDRFTAGTAQITATPLQNSGAIVVPASTTLAVNGGLQLTSASKLDIGVAGTAPGSFGTVSVSGTASLAGALSLSRSSSYNPAAGDRQQIISAGSLSGTFATTSGGNGAGFYSVIYTPTAATVVTGASRPAPVLVEVLRVAGATSRIDAKLRCPPRGSGCLAVTLKATVTVRLGGGQVVGVSARAAKSKTVAIAVGRTSALAAGSVHTLVLKLNRLGARLLQRFGKLTATVTVTEAGELIKKLKVHISAPPKQPKQHH